MNSHSEVSKSVLTSVRVELAELPEVEVHIVDFDKLKDVAKHISHSYAPIPPATSKGLEGYVQTKSASCLAFLSMTISLISFSVGFNMLRCQWKQLIIQPQLFFRAMHGRFLHIFNKLAADDTLATTAFLYLTQDELSALSQILEEVLTRREATSSPTSKASTEQRLLYPVSLTRTPHLMLDHRKTLYFQCQVMFNISNNQSNLLPSSARSLWLIYDSIIDFTPRVLSSAGLYLEYFFFKSLLMSYGTHALLSFFTDQCLAQRFSFLNA